MSNVQSTFNCTPTSHCSIAALCCTAATTPQHHSPLRFTSFPPVVAAELDAAVVLYQDVCLSILPDGLIMWEWCYHQMIPKCDVVHLETYYLSIDDRLMACERLYLIVCYTCLWTINQYKKEHCTLHGPQATAAATRNLCIAKYYSLYHKMQSLVVK